MSHKCPHCDYTTRRNNNLERHITNIHINKENKIKVTEYKCNICLKEFTTKGNCLRHEKICIEKTQKIEPIYSFMSKNKEDKLDLYETFSNMHINHSTQDIVTESIKIYNSNKYHKNIFITSLRSKICYVLGENGQWDITNKEYALDKKTKEFIQVMNDSLPQINATNERLKNFKKIWHDHFGKMISNTKFYRVIKNIMEANIYNYSREQFPDGKFSHIPCSIIQENITDHLTMEVTHVFDKMFCFTGKLNT